MIIGNFNRQAKGYVGDLITLTHRGKLTFTPASKGAEFQVTLDGIEVGAAWEKTARERQRLSLGEAGQSVPAEASELRADAAGRRQPHTGVEP